MGRLLLTAALSVLLLAAPAAGQADGAASPDAPHAEMACAACHRGGQTGRTRRGVPEATCTASGCHEEAGPKRVGLTTVDFPHRDHGEKANVRLGCAGCHTHDAGDEPLRASVDACALCHAGKMGGGNPGACRSCHEDPTFVPVTNQGVAVPHQGLPWLETGCVRCHYDVAEPPVEVSLARCRDCHDDVRAVISGGAGSDLHPVHAQFNCTSCHQGEAHHIVRMSSSVRLQCGTCHRRVHGVEASAYGESCASCHGTAHRAAQQLVLGMVPHTPVVPAYKFLQGLTCGSCHVPAAGSDLSRPVGAGEGTCVDCHRPGYGEVVGLWTRGAAERASRVGAYQRQAERALAGADDDSVALLLRRNRELLATADTGGVWHNPRLVDRIQRDAVERVRAAYRAADRTPPPAPDLGSQPRPGFCAYCHLGPDSPGITGTVPDEFHRQIPAQEAGSGG